MRRRASAVSIAARPWRHRRWLVLAPHPDDETLGAGALIAQTAAAGRFGGLVYLTDGSGSHPAQEGRASRLIAIRKREASLSLRRLVGAPAAAPLFLGWKDADPAHPDHPAFGQSCRKLAALCVRWRVDVIATTAPQESHCDHAAAAGLARAVQAMSKRPLVIADYVVWSAPPAARTHTALITAPLRPGIRRHALAAHRSQLTASIGDGFRLPKDKRAMASRDILYIRRR